MISTFLQRKTLFPSIVAFLFFTGLIAQADVLVEADEMPYFAGCEKESVSSGEKRACSDRNLIKFISNQLIYPASAKEERVEGTVYVSFVVDEHGAVISPSIVRDIGGGCGAAALDILKNMPTWEPGIHEGKKVKVKLNLPIRFSFRNDVINEKAQNYEINWGSLATEKVSKEDLEEQLNKILHVRDEYGNDKPVAELIFAFEKKKSYLEGSSAGKINNELKKIVSKCKKGGVFSITAVIQVRGEFVYVKRAFEVI